MLYFGEGIHEADKPDAGTGYGMVEMTEEDLIKHLKFWLSRTSDGKTHTLHISPREGPSGSAGTGTPFASEDTHPSSLFSLTEDEARMTFSLIMPPDSSGNISPTVAGGPKNLCVVKSHTVSTGTFGVTVRYANAVRSKLSIETKLYCSNAGLTTKDTLMDDNAEMELHFPPYTYSKIPPILHRYISNVINQPKEALGDVSSHKWQGKLKDIADRALVVMGNNDDTKTYLPMFLSEDGERLVSVAFRDTTELIHVAFQLGESGFEPIKKPKIPSMSMCFQTGL